MDWGGALLDAGALLVRELSLFAAAGFLLLGASDLAVDLAWLWLKLRSRFRRDARLSLADLPPPATGGRLAIFIPAWDEAAVIGAMLRHALQVFDHPDYRLYVGCYPNDPATTAAVEAIGDRRIRLVIGESPGPTTKADCLNRLWGALLEDEAHEGFRAKAVILHDAEDVVHSAELRLFDTLIDRHDLVQIPVLPLVDPHSRWVSGHYIDEFAESHGKELVVRAALGASLPSAGVGCAIARDALALLAGTDGQPFDAASLTEDYEIGLKLKALGRSAAFVRLPAAPGGTLITTREHFPASLDAAVSQKSRWMAGIALNGWDRLGWSGGVAERWMRLRDRQALLAALLLFAGYGALLLAAPIASIAALLGREVALATPALALMMQAGLLLLGWRLLMRFAFVAASYGWREGLRAVPRVVISNLIAIAAARRAIDRYVELRRTGAARWGKTDHIFPPILPAE